MARHSEIFDSYVKTALEKDFSKDVSSIKSKLENNPSADSYSISDIEALYGVKPNLPKDMEYKHNIMEAAHPNSMVISPAYDRINGLVENNIERQNIMINIVNKVPNGHLTGHKYAQQDLLLSLVRVANDMDNNDIDELRKLADTCADQLTNSKKKLIIEKTALVAPLIPAGYILGATIVGSLLAVLYTQQHWPSFSEGFETDYKNLQSQLDDFIKSNTNWGVGVKYKASFLQEISTRQSELSDFYNQYKAIEGYIATIDKPSRDKELLERSQTDSGKQEAQAFDQLKQTALGLNKTLSSLSFKFKDESYKLRQIEEKGMWTRLVDKTQVLHGGGGLIPDDFDDVRDAITSFEKGLISLIGVVNGGEAVAEKGKAKALTMFEKVKDKASEMMGKTKEKASEVASSAKEKASEVASSVPAAVKKPTVKKPFVPQDEFNELERQLGRATSMR